MKAFKFHIHMNPGRRKAISLLLAAVLLLGSIGCQQTPVEEAVVSKADGKLELALAATAVPEAAKTAEEVEAMEGEEIVPAGSNYPAVWQETMQLNNVSVNFDAAVECEATTYPVYLISKAEFSPELMNSILAEFAPDAETTRPIGTSSEEIYENLETAVRGMWYDDGNGNGYYGPYDGQQDDIAYWQQKLTEAKDESTPYTGFDSLPILQAISCSDGRRLYAHLWTRSLGISVDAPQEFAIQPESWVLEGAAIGDEPAGTKIDAVSITEETALEKAEEVLLLPGFCEMQIAGIEKARMVNINTSEILGSGYQITLCRRDAEYAAYDAYSYDSFNWQGDGSLSYSDMWFPQSGKIYVDERGIREMGMDTPYQVDEVVTENVELLPFDKIQELVRNRFRVGMDWSEAEGTITVSRMFLSAAMQRVKDDAEHAYILPVWICEFDMDISTYPEAVHSYVAINAVDGTVVNVQVA